MILCPPAALPAEVIVAPSDAPWRVFDSPGGEPTNRARTAGSGEAGGGFPIPPLALAGMAGAILIGAVAVAVAMNGCGGRLANGPDVGLSGSGSAASDVPSGAVVVDVTGAVVTPGVYRLDAGARVGDAIDAAGGFSPRVDADRVGTELNLAATLADGQQIRVPSRDDATGGTQGGSGGGSGGAPGSVIDLNSATQAELESLPGIGPVTAGKIIESRGGSPFRTIDELRERGLVGQKTFDSIRALIRVG